MGLENLKSVFNQGVGNTTSQPDGGIAKAPTGLNFDTLLPTPVDFLTGDVEGFSLNFDNKGVGDGTSKYIGEITSELDSPPPFEIGDKSTQYETLFNINQTPKNDVGYNYLNSNRDNLKIRFKSTQAPTNRGSEPYVISEIGDNVAGRDFPLERSVLDAERISKFLISRKGVEFIAKQNLLGLNSKVVTSGLSITGKLEKKAGNQRFQTSYNPASTLGSLVRTLGGQVPNVGLGFLLNREDPFPLDPTRILKARNYMEHLRSRGNFGLVAGGISSLLGIERQDMDAIPQEEEFYDPGDFLSQTVKKLQNAAFGNNVKDLPKKGDKLTLSEMIKGDTLLTGGESTLVTQNDFNVKGTINTNVESEKAGLPLYFKDLRDNTYVFFRGYLSGITENVSPSWASENYIGRSEPVYIYERAERDINFTLKLFATTKDELPIIYKKMNRLTSMCYPEYKKDTLLDNKQRMKPPLVKFRMGDMYGSENNEMTGWIKSISYTVPDNSVWETQTGRKVAKHIEASIGFQIIHGSPPELKTNFYGFPSNNVEEVFNPLDPVDSFNSIKDAVSDKLSAGVDKVRGLL